MNDVMPAPPVSSSSPRPAAQRATGMAILGSSVALFVIAGLTWAGIVGVAGDIRGWAATGLMAAAAVDAAIGVYFLRASSQP